MFMKDKYTSGAQKLTNQNFDPRFLCGGSNIQLDSSHKPQHNLLTDGIQVVCWPWQLDRQVFVPHQGSYLAKSLTSFQGSLFSLRLIASLITAHKNHLNCLTVTISLLSS